MTDRVRSLTIVLEKDMRIDDVEHVVETIKMIRCVESVELGPIVDLNDHLARSSAKRRIWDLLADWTKEL